MTMSSLNVPTKKLKSRIMKIFTVQNAVAIILGKEKKKGGFYEN